MFKRGFLTLGATEDSGHIIQYLRQDPRFPLQDKGRIYCSQMAITLFQRLFTLFHGKLWHQAHNLHLIRDFRLFAWSAFWFGLPVLGLLLGFDTSVPTLPHKTAAREGVMVFVYLRPASLQHSGLGNQGYIPLSACRN